jgi:hypothetical protein
MLSTVEISKRLGVSRRHARRLKADGDPRVIELHKLEHLLAAMDAADFGTIKPKKVRKR